MGNFKKIELKPMYNKQKSFYNKAKILIDENGNKYLQSYESIIAEVVNGKVKINTDVYLWASKTSLCHLKDFLYQLGYEIGTKQQLEKMYC